jgi:hypothetical protein
MLKLGRRIANKTAGLQNKGVRNAQNLRSLVGAGNTMV